VANERQCARKQRLAARYNVNDGATVSSPPRQRWVRPDDVKQCVSKLQIMDGTLLDGAVVGIARDRDALGGRSCKSTQLHV
jgi:hypothetical protein